MSGVSDFEQIKMDIINLLEQLKLETNDPDTINWIQRLKLMVKSLQEFK